MTMRGLATVIGAVTTILSSSAMAAVWSPLRVPETIAPIFPPIEIADCNAEDLFREGRIRRQSGRAGDAVPVLQDALQCVEETYGSDYIGMAFVQNELAKAYLAETNLANALGSSKRAVEMIARLSEGSPDHAKLIMTLATVHGRMGHYREAEPLYRKAYAIARSAAADDKALQATTASSLAITLRELSQYGESRDLSEEAAGLIEATEGTNAEAYGEALLDLARAHLMLDEADEASDFAERARPLLASPQSADLVEARAAINRSSLGEAEDILQKILEGEPDSPLIEAMAHYHIAFIQILRGRFVEAEETLQRALTSYRADFGDKHPAIARSQHSLAIVYNRLRRLDKAEELYQKAIETYEETVGADSLAAAHTRKEYAHLLAERGDLERAEEEARHALASFERSPEARMHSLGLAFSSLGFVLRVKGKLEDAVDAFQKGLSLIETARGAESSDLPPGLIELGQIWIDQGRLEEAGQLLQKAVAIRERDGAETAWGLAKARSALARLREAEGQPREALDNAEAAIELIEARLARQERAHTDLYQGETESERSIFELYLTIAHRFRGEVSETTDSRIFEVAQLPNLSKTSSALARLSFRMAGGGHDLGRFLRRRQDALEDWRARNQQLSDVLAKGQTTQRAQSLRDELEELDQRLMDLNDELDAIFPRHAALTKPKAISVNEVQALLEPDEAVLLQVTGKKTTHLILLTKNRLDIEQTTLGQAELKRRVDSLRRGVALGDEDVLSLDDFDVESAHRLYQSLFAPFEDALADVEHLIAVFDRDMEHLPPAMLLRSAAPEDDYGLFRFEPSGDSFSMFSKLDYLVKHLTISTLPSIGALRALRDGTEAPKDRRPFAGFGNPAFAGALSEGSMPEFEDVPRSQRLYIRQLLSRHHDPLPASEQELRALASLLGAGERDVYLGDDANETSMKQANLEAYRTIAFGTHVVIPEDESRMIPEPSLLLPISDGAESGDDGMLTESEIAELKLTADMVLLATCRRSAPPNRPGAEALSELARAFLIAGAKSLLVSHWGSDRAAMQNVTERAMEILQSAAGKGGRAGALRQAMIDMIEMPTDPRYSHPAFWAAFEIVGEGRR